MLRWFEKNRVHYVMGIAGNSRLEQKTLPLLEEGNLAKANQENVQIFREFKYAAESWNKERRVIARIESKEGAVETRYILTNLKQRDPGALYQNIYCKRANMENRLKEIKNDLYSDRTSCHRWWANQFRLSMSSLAYILMESMRRLALKGTELAKAQCSTLRLRLYKIGAIILRNTRRVRFLFSNSLPVGDLFLKTAEILCKS